MRRHKLAWKGLLDRPNLKPFHQAKELIGLVSLVEHGYLVSKLALRGTLQAEWTHTTDLSNTRVCRFFRLEDETFHHVVLAAMPWQGGPSSDVRPQTLMEYFKNSNFFFAAEVSNSGIMGGVHVTGWSFFYSLENHAGILLYSTS